MMNIDCRTARMSQGRQLVAYRIRMGLLRALLGGGLLVLVDAALADSDIALSASSPHIMPLAQGEEGQFVIRVTNNGPDPVATVTVGTAISSIFGEWYPFAMPAQSGCQGLFPGYPFDPSGFIPGYSFAVGPLAVGQHQECRFTVQRAPTAVNDGGYSWQTSGENDAVPGNDVVAFVMGSLADVGIRIDTVGFSLGADGFADGVIRLTAHNHGPTAVREFQSGFCTDNFFPGFTIDGNFAQGCGSAEYGPVCFDNGFGFMHPALAVGQSHSCLIRLRSRAAYAQPLSFPLLLQTFSLVRSDFGALADINSGNDYAEMMLGPVPAVSVHAMSGFGRWMLVGLLAIMAGRALRSV
jgi:hypothetical protein